MRILLTGAEGQLGRHLTSELQQLGDVVRTDLHGGDFACDLSDRRLLDKTLNRVRPDLIVNPAAWTAVDRAEDEPTQAMRINRDLPGWMGEWCAEHDVLLMHFSTDYVFSGRIDRGWREDDTPEPANVYGRSKLESEQVIEASGAPAVIVRTAWLYSHFPGNFLSAIMTRAQQGSPLTIVSDQIGSPTWAGDLAHACAEILKRRDSLPARFNRFHVAGSGSLSWYEFGRMAVDRAVAAGVLKAPVPVEPIASANWPQKARRPVWSVLDCSRYSEFTGHSMPPVSESLDACLARWPVDG
ncbi:MAG: dTDP-4-dehydrorhamnose reductase [Wenzhouxiangellaceae bacterium]